MRHRVFGRKLNRRTNHRKALFKNLIVGLVTHNKLQTTEAKAKAIQGLIDKLVTRAKQGTLPARRLLAAFLHSKSAVNKLVDEIAPRLKNRTSGYTRITRLGNRSGDDAMMVKVEFVDMLASTTLPPKPKKKAKPTKKTTKPAAKITLPAKVKQTRRPVTTKISSQAHRTQSKG